MVAHALKGAISEQVGYINAQVSLAGQWLSSSNTPAEFQVKNVWDYYRPNPAGADYPLVMMQHIGERNQWYTLQNGYCTRYEFDIFGLIRGNEPEVLAHAIEKFAGAITDIFAGRNMSLQLEDGTPIVYIDANRQPFFPISDIRYIESAQSDIGLVSRGFRARWMGSVFPFARDENAFVNYLNPGNQI